MHPGRRIRCHIRPYTTVCRRITWSVLRSHIFATVYGAQEFIFLSVGIFFTTSVTESVRLFRSVNVRRLWDPFTSVHVRSEQD